jgi:hypothetical protein
MIWRFLFLTSCLLAGMGQQRSIGPSRVPLEKSQIALRSPVKYERRVIGQNPTTRESIYYDPKPQVVVLDPRTRKYGLRWIGYDGKEKTVIYQKPDGIDIVVSASVSQVGGGQFLYSYNVSNLKSSTQYLSTFALQNYSAKVNPTRTQGLYVGGITRNSREFKEGNWVGFSVLSQDVSPGHNLEVSLRSASPPGLVECRVAGVLGMKGVGEEMPQELENLLPGYEAWPHGYTIGPIDELMSRSRGERVKYLINLFPQLRKLGWVSPVVARWYEQNLKQGNFSEVVKHSEQDVNTGKITPEIRAMIQLVSY